MDEVRTDIDAPPEAVYGLVADVTNMGRWSPETYRTAWVGGHTEPVVGARFRGWNRTKVWGVPATWATTSIVRQADPGRAFSFETPFSGARWTYRFEPTATGCTVTETREEIAEPLGVKLLYAVVGGVRRRQLADGMATTLQRLKDAAEAAEAPAGPS